MITKNNIVYIIFEMYHLRTEQMKYFFQWNHASVDEYCWNETEFINFIHIWPSPFINLKAEKTCSYK